MRWATLRLKEMMGRPDDGHSPPLIVFGDDSLDQGNRRGVEVGCRLVEQEDLRLQHERPSQGRKLPLTAGERADRA